MAGRDLVGVRAWQARRGAIGRGMVFALDGMTRLDQARQDWLVDIGRDEARSVMARPVVAKLGRLGPASFRRPRTPRFDAESVTTKGESNDAFHDKPIQRTAEKEAKGQAREAQAGQGCAATTSRQAEAIMASDQIRIGEPSDHGLQLQMLTMGTCIDRYFNDIKSAKQQYGFCLVVFPFGENGTRCDFVSNIAHEDLVRVLEGQVAYLKSKNA